MHHQPRRRTQRALVAHVHPCTHAARTCICRAHGRTTCTQEHHRWPISACARSGKHAASQLAADVAAPKMGAPAALLHACRVDGTTTSWPARRRWTFLQPAVDRGCSNRVAESRRGRSAACE
eukprot:3544766-Prymnesium_polylepis.1